MLLQEEILGDRFDAEVGIHINLAQGKLNLARTTRCLKAW